MFVRFPIILARPTSLRGSLSPDLWRKVIGRTPGGVFPRTVSGTQNSGLSCFCCLWCDKPWKNTQRGRLACVRVPTFLLCASHPVTQTPVCPSAPAGAAVGAARTSAPSPGTASASLVCAALLSPSWCLPVSCESAAGSA